MTIPVPVNADPMADAALHIRNFATAVDGKLTTGIAVRTFDTGVQTANGDGSITAGSIPGLATIAGCICGPVYVYQDQNSVQWVPLPVRDPNTGATFWCRCFNAPTNTVNVGKQQRVCGIAWGPPAAAADKPIDLPDRPVVAPSAPGDLFPRGTTPHGLRYPGTDEVQYRTAAAIGDLADDIGKALGGAPMGLHLAYRAGVYITDAAGWFGVDMAPDLSLVRGAVATAWDTAGSYVEARLMCWEERGYTGGSTGSKAGFYVFQNRAAGGAPNNYPARHASSGVGATVLAWGDA